MFLDQIFSSADLRGIQSIGLIIAAAGLFLVLTNSFVKKDEKEVNIELLGQKINGPRSLIVFLAGLVFVVSPAWITKPVDKPPPPPVIPSSEIASKTKSETTGQDLENKAEGAKYTGNGSGQFAAPDPIKNTTAVQESLIQNTPSNIPSNILGWAFFGAYDDGSWAREIF